MALDVDLKERGGHQCFVSIIEIHMSSFFTTSLAWNSAWVVVHSSLLSLLCPEFTEFLFFWICCLVLFVFDIGGGHSCDRSFVCSYQLLLVCL